MRAAGGFQQTPVIDGILEPRPAAETWAIRAGRCQDDPVGFCHGRFGEDSRITAGHKYNRGRITAAAIQGAVQYRGREMLAACRKENALPVRPMGRDVYQTALARRRAQRRDGGDHRFPRGQLGLSLINDRLRGAEAFCLPAGKRRRHDVLQSLNSVIPNGQATIARDQHGAVRGGNCRRTPLLLDRGAAREQYKCDQDLPHGMPFHRIRWISRLKTSASRSET